MKLFANPVFLRMLIVLAAGGFSFVLGALLIRRMRRSLIEESAPASSVASLDRLPLFTYQAVIQELKQQKYELQNSQHEERRRAKTSENISAAILSHLSSGVLFIAPNGLIRQANAAARQILGFASPVGMSLGEVFREASVMPGQDSAESAAEILQHSVAEKTPFRRIETHYRTPAGEQRVLQVTATSVRAPNGDVLGAACLINDQTELMEIRREQVLHGELSGEMALALRSSVATIAECARQLSAANGEDSERQLAADIAAEAEDLERNIGGFLVDSSFTRAAATSGM